MYGLTTPQQLIYNMEKFGNGSISVLCGSMLLKGERDLAQLKQMVHTLFRINDVLRTRIIETENGTMQIVSEYTKNEVSVLHFADKDKLDTYAVDYAQQPLDLYGVLAEIHLVLLPKSYGLLVKMHHIIADAWSFALMGTQVHAILRGEVPAIYSYKEYAYREHKYWKSNRQEIDREFFLRQYQKYSDIIYLSEKRQTTLEAARKTFIIGKDQAMSIYEYANRHKISPFILFMTALSVYFSRIKMNAEKFYIGTAILNRTGKYEKNTMGMFINTVPLLVELDNSKSFADNANIISKSAMSAMRHQKYGYGNVLSDIRAKNGSSEKLYDVLFSYQNATINADDEFQTTWYHNGRQVESLQMHVDDRDCEGFFTVHYDHQIEKFTEQEIDRLHQHICNLIFDAITHDEKNLQNLNLLAENEQKRILTDFNNTIVKYPRGKCIHMLFEEQVEKIPNNLAIIACDRTLTYSELNEQANRIAYSLIEQGIGVGDIVTLLLTRKSYWFSAMLGILKTGAAYLPINSEYPDEKIAFILSDSQAKFHVTDNNIESLMENDHIENPRCTVCDDDLCYCIYTSGSTGIPKGVLITHKNAVNFVDDNPLNVRHQIVQKKHRRILSITAVWFDMFVTESLLPLANGMEVLFADEKQSKMQAELNTLLHKFPAEVMETTPTKMNLLIQDTAQLDYIKQMKTIILGGESLDSTLLKKLRHLTDANIFNNYGPTEATVWATASKLYGQSDITIGSPLANTQVYILDKFLNPVPLGVTGELCIAGDCISAGYLNRPELTAEKFINNPYGEGKLYRTGDLAYWREDGKIVYVGRNDFQVKIRGLRIELGEIENAAATLEGVLQAVVVVRKDDDGRQFICTFYTGRDLPAKEMRDALAKKLPKYMMPHIFTHLEEMPLTASGKVNRRALPEIELHGIEKGMYIKPEGALEKRLAALMGIVLQHAPISRDDDFFDLGGDSLSAIEFVSRAHGEGIFFSLQDIFNHPTVRQLAECIEQGTKPNMSFVEEDFMQINEILARNKTEAIDSPPAAAPIGNMLLAGATGFLGAHILADYLDHDEGTAFCLVRGESQAESEKRLRETLRFYFGGQYEATRRVRVICADLEKERFGLSVAGYDELGTHIDTVVNAAASVKHYGTYQYFYRANVDTVRHLMEFCQKAAIKLIHVSTISVSGNSLVDQYDGYASSEMEKHFYESSLYIDQPLDNVYVRSKFEAEKLILEAMTQGFKANIMRMGNLTNRYSDGLFQRNYKTNAFLKRIKAFLTMCAFPDYLLELYVEFTPVDVAASAIMTIARRFTTKQTVFHINNTKVIYLDRLLSFFSKLDCPIQIVPAKQFTTILRKTVKNDKTAFLFETFINDIDANDRLNYENNIHIENEFTENYLKLLGFEWPEIGMDYLRKYINYFRNIGYIN